MATQKTTKEIRALLIQANIDFETAENNALNEYLPKILHSCPLTQDVYTTKQCIDCEIFKNLNKIPTENKATQLKSLPPRTNILFYLAELIDADLEIAKRRQTCKNHKSHRTIHFL